jgi:inorganic pyrophosphatase
MRDAEKYLGKTVKIIIDRPLGSAHPRFPGLIYGVNYGYIPETVGGDGEETDVYLLGVDEPVCEYTAKIIGVIYREDDVEFKLVATPEGLRFNRAEIAEAVHFQEKYFKTEIVTL